MRKAWRELIHTLMNLMIRFVKTVRGTVYDRRIKAKSEPGAGNVTRNRHGPKKIVILKLEGDRS
jgi:hypothetical protein